MGLLNFLVRRHFRDEEAGRVVVFPGDLRNRGYAVKSETEEQKIRAFLKMYYCAELSIQVVSLLVVIGWMTQLTYGSEYSFAHSLKSGAIFMGIYSLVVAIPFYLLWTTSKKEALNFVSAQDEVVVSGSLPKQQQAVLTVCAIAFAILILLAVFMLVRAK